MPNLSSLLPSLKSRLRDLTIGIKDEDLVPASALPSTTFKSRHKNWKSFPVPLIRKIDAAGIETLLHSPADYSLNLTDGEVTLTSATSDIIRASYNFDPVADSELMDELESARKEVSTLVFRTIDPLDVHESYSEAITKRAYTNVLKKLVVDARDFYSISIAGRSINKDSIVQHYNQIIEQNEKQLLSELNILRYYNTSRRLDG
jgi:hypothetical protein